MIIVRVKLRGSPLFHKLDEQGKTILKPFFSESNMFDEIKKKME